MLKLYNSLTKKQEEIKIDQDDVRIYLCGPTVQSSPHLGHGRSAVVFDFFIRYLKYLNYSVLFARNITDIDDKIIEKSQEKNISYRELGDNVWKEFVLAHENLNCLVPDIEPRATAYIPEIIKYIEQLVQNGFGYVTSSGVYYDVSKFEEYLELSGRSIEDVRTGTRVETEDDKKRAEDFALWKFSKENEPSWDSPWGDGRPGWHIECSTMISETLGKTIDFHCGGIDLIFPHHENEIAQSKCSNDSEFANYWIHSGLLKIGGEKMSKSLGNFALIKDLIKQYHFEVIRLFLISSHYRSELSFDDGSLNQARAALERLYTTLQLNDEDAENTAKENPFIEAFEMAMNDDLNTPKAVSILFDLAKELNSNKDKNSRNEQLYAFKTIANNLGLLTDKPENFFKFGAEVDDLFIQEKIDARNLARNQKDFVRADEIRDELSDMGVLLDDGPDGTTWKIEKPN